MIFTLIGVIAFLLGTTMYTQLKLHKLRQKSVQIISALDDIQKGNFNRRILATNNDFTDEICYKINQIAQTYAWQLSQIELTVETNKQIMTSLSHDIRTPLTTLMGYLEAIQNDISKDDEKKQYIETAQSKANTLKDYTDDLFEWFKIQSNEKSYNFEDIDINELSRGIIIDWIPQFEKAGVSYKIEIPDKELIVSLDIVSYNRIINNLVHNAVKHSGGTRICITVDDLQNSAVVTISDNGKGIGEKDLPYVFDRLYKCDDARATGSSGLGLSIVQALVNAHGGVVSVDSAPNIKTTFTVSMKKARLR